MPQPSTILRKASVDVKCLDWMLIDRTARLECDARKAFQ
jgi:hypothetical protein